jgi:hypothetical protein
MNISITTSIINNSIYILTFFALLAQKVVCSLRGGCKSFIKYQSREVCLCAQRKQDQRRYSQSDQRNEPKRPCQSCCVSEGTPNAFHPRSSSQ